MLPPETTVSIALIFSVIAAIGTISTIVSTIKRDREAETNKQVEIEKNFVKINVKLDDMLESIRKISKSTEDNSERIKDMNGALIQCTERIQTLFKRSDDHERRINDLEEKCKLVLDCTRDYEGDCQYAQTVKILAVGEPIIGNYIGCNLPRWYMGDKFEIE